MGEGIYRDALLGLRARIADLVARIAEHEHRVTVDLVHFLPLDLQHRIATARTARSHVGEAFEELSREEEREAAYLALLDEALALVPALERELRALPPEAPELARAPSRVWGAGWGLQMSESLTTVGAVLARVVARHDPRAELEALDEFAFRARLTAMQSPISLLVECFVSRDRPLEPHVQIGTSVARGASKVRVAPESWSQTLARQVGLFHALLTNDPDFDDRFIVEGDAAQAARILSPPVRASLLAIAHDDVPELVVQDGHAILRWSFEPTERALDAAFFVLGRVRAADVSLRLTP